MTSLIETLDYEAAFLARKQAFATSWAAVRALHPELPDYDVSMLETDPIIVLLQASTFDDVLLRARVNDAAVRANLYQMATGADLDLHAAFYGVARLTGEGDIALRQRIELAIVGRSAGGPVERYEAVARGVASNIKAVRVYQVNGGPALRCSVLTADNGGVPSNVLLASVQAALNAPGVLCVNDQITAVAAVNVTQAIVANVWLLPDAPAPLVDSLDDAIRAAWAAEAGIGFDLDPSWIVARLMAAGVSRVEVVTPSARVIAADESAIAIGTITLSLAGRSR